MRAPTSTLTSRRARAEVDANNAKNRPHYDFCTLWLDASTPQSRLTPVAEAYRTARSCGHEFTKEDRLEVVAEHLTFLLKRNDPVAFGQLMSPDTILNMAILNLDLDRQVQLHSNLTDQIRGQRSVSE